MLMLEVMLHWVVTIWSTAFVLGFYLATEESQ